MNLGDFASPMTFGLDSIGDWISGGDDASEAAEAQIAMQERAIEEQRRAAGEARGFLSPYEQYGAGSLGRVADYLGGRDFTADPYAQQQIDRGVETANRLAAGMGLGGGARAKRLMNEAMLGANQFRQQEINNLMGLGQTGLNAAQGMANVTTGEGTNVGNLYTAQGDARAGGILGDAAIQQQRLGNVLQLGGMAAGAMGGPAGAAIGSSIGSSMGGGNPVGTMYGTPSIGGNYSVPSYSLGDV